ncbi:MAG: rhodanese-like domain-containing protein [Pseudomonadota bacterium]
MSKVTSADLIAAAKAAIDHISVDDAKPLAGGGDVVFVDVRDSKELEAGAIPGAVHAPRGGLEFALDPASDFAVAELVSGKRLVMVCGSGGRAAFATKLAKDMGHDAVCLEGGFKGWKAGGGPVA